MVIQQLDNCPLMMHLWTWWWMGCEFAGWGLRTLVDLGGADTKGLSWGSEIWTRPFSHL
jgi:hypothetical protein